MATARLKNAKHHPKYCPNNNLLNNYNNNMRRGLLPLAYRRENLVSWFISCRAGGWPGTILPMASITLVPQTLWGGEGSVCLFVPVSECLRSGHLLALSSDSLLWASMLLTWLVCP